jgi:hypothetical protein
MVSAAWQSHQRRCRAIDMRSVRCIVLACVVTGCGWPGTRVRSVADYAATTRPTVSGFPAYEAGTNYRYSYSPDGANLFICADGHTEPASAVIPGGAPAC